MLAANAQAIVAIATPAGRGAVGMVRVSGPDLRALVQALCGRALLPRQATYLPFLDDDGQAIDQGLAIYFPAPHSYTGEDVLELQAHGGPIVLQLLQARCLRAAAQWDPGRQQSVCPGLRLAEPGEFTQRAFLNNKLDLAQAEAVSDLIDASTEAAARGASRSLQGAFSGEVQALLEALIRLRMLVESTLDFPEEDIDFLQQADAQGQLDALCDQVQSVLRQTRQGALLRDGMQVVIAGQPNAGKSSLLNALAGMELAIVTPVAGTTRDVVSQTLQIEGVPIHVLDTAGLRETDDAVERIGIERAWQAIERADALLFVHDATQQDDPDHQARDQRLRARLPAGLPAIEVWNKCDVASVQPSSVPHEALAVSAKQGQGLADLRQRLLQIAGWQQAAGEGLYSARQRHVQALHEVAEHLKAAQMALAQQAGALDLLAEDLRQAQQALARITGDFSADDLLGEIFSRFCIGK
jgi:tRNA modification GTPase